ncbi:hypothetical protein MAR_038152, partial [Mya arenaria]
MEEWYTNQGKNASDACSYDAREHDTYRTQTDGHITPEGITQGHMAHGNMVFSTSYQSDFILKDVKSSTVGGKF